MKALALIDGPFTVLMLFVKQVALMSMIFGQLATVQCQDLPESKIRNDDVKEWNDEGLSFKFAGDKNSIAVMDSESKLPLNHVRDLKEKSSKKKRKCSQSKDKKNHRNVLVTDSEPDLKSNRHPSKHSRGLKEKSSKEKKSCNHSKDKKSKISKAEKKEEKKTRKYEKQLEKDEKKLEKKEEKVEKDEKKLHKESGRQ